MTDLEIAYPEIVTLIEAYEKALFKKMQKDPSDSDVRVAYMANLINMESITQAHIDASKISAARIVSSLVSELKSKEREEDSNFETKSFALSGSKNNSQINPKKNNDKNPKTWGDYKYSECTVTDINGKEYSVNDPNAPDVFDLQWHADKENNLTEDRWFDGQEIKKKYQARIANKFEANYSAKVTQYLDNKITGGTGKLKGSKFSLEECLNCVINIDLGLLLPNLEIIIDFSKILNEIKKLLQQLLNDLDPTKLLSMICDFFLKFGKNFLCPQNLIGIELLLPTLFSKFSFDLAKFRFDWTALVGPLIKNLLTFLVSLIENIPKITNPIIDCLINSITTVMKALQSVASAIDKGANELAEGIERVVNKVYSVVERFREFLHSAKLTSLGSDSLESDMLKDLFEEFLKENPDLFNSDGETMNLEGFKRPSMDLELQRLVQDFVDYLNWNKENSDNYYDSNKALENISLQEIGLNLIKWLEIESNFEKFYNILILNQPSSDQWKKRDREIKDLVNTWDSYKKDIEKELKEEQTDRNKKYFKAGFTVENKGITFPGTLGMKPGAKINKYQTKVPYIGIAKTKKLKEYYLADRGFDEAKNIDKEKYKWDDYLFAKYGLDVKSEYRNVDFVDIPTLNLRKKFDDTVFKFVDERILYYLRIAKSWINESVGNVVKALKALQQFIGEAFDAEFKILGEIQEILQIIRFVRLIIELLSNGLSNCDELKKNKEVFKSVLEKSQRNPSNGNYETNNNALTLLDDNEVSNMGLDPEDHIVMVTKDRKYNSVINLNECADVSRHLEINDNNLDLIYEGIENGRIV